MHDVFHNNRRAAINDRVRTDCEISRSPYRRRHATKLELAIEALQIETGSDVVSMVFWSIAIAAEPIHRRTVDAMLVSHNVRTDDVTDAIDLLMRRNFVRFAGGAETYAVAKHWWYYLRLFGGHYDTKFGMTTNNGDVNGQEG